MKNEEEEEEEEEINESGTKIACKLACECRRLSLLVAAFK